jgi:hypothetical protein
MRGPMKTSALLLAAALTFPLTALGQVNTEQYRPDGEGRGLSSTTDVGLALRTGNIELISLTVNEGITWAMEGGTAFVVGRARYAAKRTRADQVADADGSVLDPEARYISDGLAHARYSHILNDAWNAELFGQAEVNEFLLLDRRLLGGLGLRRRLLSGDRGSVYIGSSWMLEHELLDTTAIADDEAASVLAHRWSTMVTGALSLGESASLAGTAYVQPRFDDLADMRILGEFSLDADVSQRVSLGLNLRLRHDSAPPAPAAGAPSLLATDVELSHSLTLRF